MSQLRSLAAPAQTDRKPDISPKKDHMTFLLWIVVGATAFLFNLLNYILVVHLHDEHQALYKELGEPSAFHFLLRSSKLFSLHPYTRFIVFREYRSKLNEFRGLFGLCQWMFGCIIICLLALAGLIVQSGW